MKYEIEYRKTGPGDFPSAVICALVLKRDGKEIARFVPVSPGDQLEDRGVETEDPSALAAMVDVAVDVIRGLVQNGESTSPDPSVGVALPISGATVADRLTRPAPLPVLQDRHVVASFDA
jgi:hypothetical protein